MHRMSYVKQNFKIFYLENIKNVPGSDIIYRWEILGGFPGLRCFHTVSR